MASDEQLSVVDDGGDSGEELESSAMMDALDLYAFCIPLNEIHALSTTKPTVGWPRLIIILKSGISYPPLYFHTGGWKEFIQLQHLQTLVPVVPSTNDSNVYLVNEPTPLQTSLAELQLRYLPGELQVEHLLVTHPDSAPHILHKVRGSGDAKKSEAKSNDNVTTPPTVQRSSRPPLPTAPVTANVQTSSPRIQPPPTAAVQTSSTPPAGPAQGSVGPAQGPSASVSEPFSVVTGYSAVGRPFGLLPNLVWKIAEGASLGVQMFRSSVSRGPPDPASHRHHHRRSRIRPSERPPAAAYTTHEEHAGDGELDEFDSYLIVDPHTDVMPPPPAYGAQGPVMIAPKVSAPVSAPDDATAPAPVMIAPTVHIHVNQRSPTTPLTASEWQSCFDSEGKIKEPERIKERIFYSGIDPDIRTDVWPFIFGMYPWTSTSSQREKIFADKSNDYAAIQTQWMSILPVQLSRFSLYRDLEHRIVKDVIRTDRQQPIFTSAEINNSNDEIEVANNRGLALLRRLLMTYAWLNFDLGYVQGLSDLLAPIVVLYFGHGYTNNWDNIDDEVTVFWVFAGLMDYMNSHFNAQQTGMHKQLLRLKESVKHYLPNLYSHLERNDCLHFYFTFRWLLLVFKREFVEYDDVYYYWDRVFCGHIPVHDMPLFSALYLLSKHTDHILQEELPFDLLLKFINDLGGTLAARDLVEGSIAWYENWKLEKPEILESVFQPDTSSPSPSTH